MMVVDVDCSTHRISEQTAFQICYYFMVMGVHMVITFCTS